MKNQRDKNVIEHWVRLYDRLNGASYTVESWPDDDSSKKNIDAMCRDLNGRTFAVEHTLIEPFANEKNDAARFARTLMSLENHARLLQPGYFFMASQPVGSIPTGTKWSEIPNELLRQLPTKLSTLPDGDSSVDIQAERWELSLRIKKMRLTPGDPGKFLTGRIYPGDPGPELIIRALEKKIPKLSASRAEKKLLLLEKDAVAGTSKVSLSKSPRNTRSENCWPESTRFGP